MCSFERMQKFVMVSDMTGTIFDPKARCARCNLKLTGESTKIGKFSYNVQCGESALETMSIEKNADRTRIITRYEDLRYRALTTTIGQYGRLTAGDHNPFNTVHSVGLTFKKWEVSQDDMIDYCGIRWSRMSQRVHRDMIIEHLSSIFG